MTSTDIALNRKHSNVREREKEKPKKSSARKTDKITPGACMGDRDTRETSTTACFSATWLQEGD